MAERKKTFPGNAVIPGNIVDIVPPKGKNQKIILGPGLRHVSDEVIVTKCGVLKRKDTKYWVDSYQKRYVPVKGEAVIGVVTMKVGDFFMVDIGSSCPATLSYLAFEGATKKFRPQVQNGDLVFARLLEASKDMEPELVCVDSNGKKNGLGVLSQEGFMFTTSLNVIRKILSPDCKLQKTLGERMPYEMVAGMNGRVWVRGRSMQETIAIANAIMMVENLTMDQIQEACDDLVKGK